MFDDHYIDWRKSRIRGINKYIKNDFFEDKRLLELGCGYGDLGNIFYYKGCNEVICSDARSEYVDKVKEKYSYLKTMIFDCDKDTLKEKYDIILHWGVLYHLKSIDTHLKNVCDNCDYLFLETEVCHTNEILNTNITEQGDDQAFNGIGSRPSARYVELILEKNNFEYKMIMDNILNTGFHFYDWKVTEIYDNLYDDNGNKMCKTFFGQRRYWICWKKGKESPFKNNFITLH